MAVISCPVSTSGSGGGLVLLAEECLEAVVGGGVVGGYARRAGMTPRARSKLSRVDALRVRRAVYRTNGWLIGIHAVIIVRIGGVVFLSRMERIDGSGSYCIENQSQPSPITKFCGGRIF